MKDRKAIKAQIGKATEVVRRVVHEWDPYGLLRMGAPQDEWDSEIFSLVGQVPRISSEKDAALAISRIFSSAFQPDGFSPDDCEAVGKKLFDSLREAGFPLNADLAR